MKVFTESESSVSPVIGVILLLVITVIMASTIAASVFFFAPASKGPYAVVRIEEAKGGSISDIATIRFNQNWITLIHKGGDKLGISQTEIRITGYGETQNMMQNPPFGVHAEGDITIYYEDLKYSGKLESRPNLVNDHYSTEYHGYEFHNKELEDGFWSPGEKLTLNGQDSINSNESSTVKVQINNVPKTSNNWRFRSGENIEITIIDIPSQQIIAEISTIVKQV